MEKLLGPSLFIIGLLISIVSGIIGFKTGYKEAEIDWKRESVKHKCGDFVVTDTLTGTTEFQWKR